MGSADKLFALTVRAVSDLGYSITHSDAGGRTVSFETGMSWRTRHGQQMSGSVIANDAIAELVISGGRRGQQLGEWGEKEAIAQKIHDKVLELAPTTPDAPYESAAPPASDGTRSTSGELERLAKLHQDGLLTVDEFSAAKAKLLA